MFEAVKIIEIVIGIGLLIMVHELGHFLAAKWAGVRVDKFALGMGPRLVAWQRGETEYSIRIIPVGGFVAMAGEEPGAETNAPPERQFRHQTPGKRAVILFAGVFMNFILTIVLFSIAYGVGVEFTRPVIGVVAPEGPADKAGLLPGDEIIACDGVTDVNWEDVRTEIMMTDPGDEVRLTVRRDGETHVLTVRSEVPAKGELPAIGIQQASGRTIVEIEKDSPASTAGLEAGDRIDLIDGTRYLHWQDAVYHMSARIGEAVAVEAARRGAPVSVRVVPRPASRGEIGITPRTFPMVARVLPGTPAERAGLEPDDEVRAVGGVPTPIFDDLVTLTSPHAGKPLVFTIRRGEKTLDVTMTPEARPGHSRGMIGIAPRPEGSLVVGRVAPGSAADRANVKPDDVLTAIDDVDLEKTPSWDVFQAALNAAAETKRKVTLHWRSGEARWKKAVTVDVVDDPIRADVGISVNPGMPMMQRYSPWAAPGVGLRQSWRTLKLVYVSLKKLLTARVSAKHAAGPVGIAKLSYRIAEQGVTKFLWWIAFLGVNIAVFNLLPMPPFDGGLLLLTAVEKVRGKSISDKWLMRLQLAGWAVVIVFILFITYNDIMR